MGRSTSHGLQTGRKITTRATLARLMMAMLLQLPCVTASTGFAQAQDAHRVNLVNLDLDRNDLLGPIPDGIGRLTQMHRLKLSHNLLSGSIPSTLVSCTEIQHLEASLNSLSGPIPEAATRWEQLLQLSVKVNRLRGSIPSSLGTCTGLQYLQASNNGISGPIPEAGMQWKHMLEMHLRDTALSGHIPDAVGSWSSLSSFRVSVHPRWQALGKSLSGSIPDAFHWMTRLHDLRMGDHRLSGTLPDGLAGSARGSAGVFWNLQNNRLSGAWPAAFDIITMLEEVWVDHNDLAGRLPDGFASFRDMSSARMGHNKLFGTIPQAVALMSELYILDLECNKLSGSLPHFVVNILGELRVRYNRLSGAIPRSLAVTVFVNDNQLAGSIPPSRIAEHLLCSNNYLEGSLPEIVSPWLSLLDVSGRADMPGQVSGPLPAGLSRRTQLTCVIAAQQALEGVIPLFKSTLDVLAVQRNRLRVFTDVALGKETAVVLYSNLLSCHLPWCGDASAKFSLCGLGNSIQQPHGRRLPAWVSPIERDSLFWASDSEGLEVLLKAIAASAFFIFTAVVTLCTMKSPLRKSMWIVKIFPCLQLTLAWCHFLRALARHTLTRISLLIALFTWDLYKCPRTLVLASACLRNSTCIHIFVVLLWGSLCFHSRGGDRSTDREEHSEVVTARKTTSSSSTYVLWLSWFGLTLLLSSVSLVWMIAKSVPGLLDSQSLWIIKLCVSGVQALLGTFLLPYLARKLSPRRKYVLTTAANLLMNCLFPLIVFIYLDVQCLGHWASWWRPCRSNTSDQLTRIVTDRGGRQFSMTVLAKDDICRHSNRVRWMPTCMEVALLRLQDMWSTKFIISGLIIPAGQISRSQTLKPTEAIADLVLLFSYAIITSGHLPIIMTLLLIAALGKTLAIAVVAVSSSGAASTRVRRGSLGFDIPGVTMARGLSTVVQLASASGSPLALALATLFVLSHWAGRHGQLPTSV